MPYLNRDSTEDEPIDCRILTAGLDLFVENGYHNVSVHDVQKSAGVSIGSIYKHFGGKEGVAKRLYEHLLGELDEMLDDVISTEETPEKRCRELIRRLFDYTETRTNIIAFVFNAKHREFLSNEPPMCSSKPFAKMRGIVDQGMDEGVFKRVDSFVAVSMVFGSAIRMIQLRLDGVVERPLPEYFDEIVATAWHGMSLKKE